MPLVPVLVGVYAIAGLFIQRAIRGSSAPLLLEKVLVVGGTSAAAAAVTPLITRPFICPRKPLSPFIDAGVSSGLVYGLMRLEGVDAEGAAMFLPVQVLSTLLAHQVARMIKLSHKKSLEQQDQQESSSQ